MSNIEQKTILRKKRKIKSKNNGQYFIIMNNNEVTPFSVAILMLHKVFNLNIKESSNAAIEIHHKGFKVVFSGTQYTVLKKVKEFEHVKTVLINDSDLLVSEVSKIINIFGVDFTLPDDVDFKELLTKALTALTISVKEGLSE